MSVVFALALVEVLVRQGERRGSDRRRMVLTGFAVIFATDAIVILLQLLWTTAS